MKTRVLYLIFLLSLTLLSMEKRVSEISNLKFYVKEESSIENSTVKTEYWLTLILPDKMKKEIVFPELNKGETYTYSNGKKKTYLPFFNQSSLEDISSEENRILEFVKEIIKRDLEDENFKENYYQEKIKIFNLKNNEKIEIERFEKIEGYLLPKEIKVYLGDSHISTLIISAIEININLNKKEFEI